MALDITISHYSDGTATVTGVNVTGQGTAWAKLRKGDLYGTHLGYAVRIAEVIDDTHLTLAHDVPALYQTGAAYEIQRTPYDLGYLKAVQDLLEDLGSGPLASIGGLDGTGGDKLIKLTGPGAAEAFAAKLLLALNGLDGSGGNKGIVLTGEDTVETFALTAYVRTLLGSMDAPAARDGLDVPSRAEASVLAGFRNKLVNGTLVINQRTIYPVVIAPGATAFVLDRFFIYNNTNQTLTVVRGEGPPGFVALPDRFRHFLSVSVPAVATGSFYFIQNIENVRTISDTVATHTLYAAADNAGSSLRNYIEQRFGSGGSPNVFTVFADFQAINGGGGAGWKKFQGATMLPSLEGKSEGANSYIHWVAEVQPRAAGNIYLSYASFVEGDATADPDPSAPRHIQQELALCQRYAQLRNVLWRWDQPTQEGVSMGYTDQFLVPMRSAPSVQVQFNASIGFNLIGATSVKSGACLWVVQAINPAPAERFLDLAVLYDAEL